MFRHDLAAGPDTALVNSIQPAVSPDGRFLAYEQGGLRVLDLTTLESRLVRDEETGYRMKPVWTPDGRSILYVTEDEGSNDIRVLSATGGDPIELTVDAEHHEMSPTPSPDGRRFAFVAFRAGVPTLFTADIAGGRPNTWREVKITARRARTATGRVRIRVLGTDGRAMPGSSCLLGARRAKPFVVGSIDPGPPQWTLQPALRGPSRSRSSGSPTSRRVAGTRATLTFTTCIRDSASATRRSFCSRWPR